MANYHNEGETATAQCDIGAAETTRQMFQVNWWMALQSSPDPESLVRITMTCVDPLGNTTTFQGEDLSGTSTTGSSGIWLVHHGFEAVWTVDFEVLAGAPVYDWQLAVIGVPTF